MWVQTKSIVITLSVVFIGYIVFIFSYRFGLAVQSGVPAPQGADSALSLQWCHIFGIIMSPWLRPGPSVHYYAAACNCFILITGRPQETVIRPPRPQHWTVFSQLVGHTFCAKGIKSTCLNYAQCFLSKYLRWTTFMVGCTAPHCHCPSVTSWTCWVGLTTIIFICLIAIAEIAAQNDLYVQQSVAPRTGASQIYPYLAV